MALISPASDGVIIATDELLEAIINSAAFVTAGCADGGDASFHKRALILQKRFRAATLAEAPTITCRTTGGGAKSDNRGSR